MVAKNTIFNQNHRLRNRWKKVKGVQQKKIQWHLLALLELLRTKIKKFVVQQVESTTSVTIEVFFEF